MKFLEKDLENIIYNSLNTVDGTKNLIDRGLNFIKHKPFICKRQFRIGNYGIIDLLTVHRDEIKNYYTIDSNSLIPVYTIYELKKNKIDYESLIQLSRYLTGIQRYLRFKDYENINSLVHFKLILIGREVLTDDHVYLYKLMNADYSDISISVYEYDYSLDGLKFQLHDMDGYKLIEEGFCDE